MPPRGGRLSTGTSGGPRIGVAIRIEGLEKTSQEFKEARRGVNARLRSVMQRAGEQTALPRIRAKFTGGASGRWAGSLFVKKDRQSVFIGSKLRGSMNRAVGWIDFGGKRPLDSSPRRGPKVIVNTLADLRTEIDAQALLEVMREFDPLDRTP